MKEKFLVVLWCGLTLSMCLCQSAMAQTDRWNQLLSTFNREVEAGDYSAAAKAASKLRSEAEGPLRSRPSMLVIAIQRQGVVLARQGKHDKSLPLFEWSLKRADSLLAKGQDRGDIPVTLLATMCSNLAHSHNKLGNPKEALKLYRRCVSLDAKQRTAWNDMAWIQLNNRDFDEAESGFKRAITLVEKELGREHQDVAYYRANLGRLYTLLSRYDEAEAILLNAIKSLEKSGVSDISLYLGWMGDLRQSQGRYPEAEVYFKRQLEIERKIRGESLPGFTDCLRCIAFTFEHQARYEEAERLYLQAIAIDKKNGVTDHAKLNNLGGLYHQLGRYADAEELYKKSLALREKTLGSDHAMVGCSWNNLGCLYRDLGRHAEADVLFRRSLKISIESLHPTHPEVGTVLTNMGGNCVLQGRYAEAVSYLQRGLLIYENVSDGNHPHAAVNLSWLGSIYQLQGQYSKAAASYQRSLKILRFVYDENHPMVLNNELNLASVQAELGDVDSAEQSMKKALASYEKSFGKEHPWIGSLLTRMGNFCVQKEQFEEAEELFKRSMRMQRSLLGANHPSVAQILYRLAELNAMQERYPEAEEFVEQALTIANKSGARTELLYKCYTMRSRLAKEQNRQSEALADIREAMKLAEELRTESSGAAHERATAFSMYSDAFELMVKWQVELGDVNAAFQAMERGKARSLLDELSHGNADLDLGRNAIERESLQRQKTELETQVKSLEKQIELLTAKETSEENTKNLARLKVQLTDARAKLYEHYRDKRNSNPIYRNLLSVGAGPPRISQIQRRILDDNTRLLVYLIGQDGGYLAAISRDQATLHTLDVDESSAEVLGIEAGRLTAERLTALMLTDDGKGVVQQIRQVDGAKAAKPKLAALWEILIPKSERDQLVDGEIKRLVVVPDAQLAMLPFEMLVVDDTREDAKYLIDLAATVHYAPSVTVLYNLKERVELPRLTDREPVLTVADPKYNETPNSNDLAQVSVSSRFGTLGGKLTPLPFSGEESNWVKQAFRESEIPCVQFIGQKATEENLRSAVEGRRVVHLACHGYADQSYGNFFGALALTPGDEENASNDGFLTLPEIYELNLKNCELAILSACETNFGPQQRGEGIWALSRGFLVAGSRRTVASNWLVDDEAAASLISYFCDEIAEAEVNGKQPDYAQSLRNAKRWVRSQKKWRSPYYWGTFVLVGPN